MKNNLKNFPKSVLGLENGALYGEDVRKWKEAFEKELQEKYEQALVENTKTIDSSHLSFTAGQLRTLREVLGEE